MVINTASAQETIDAAEKFAYDLDVGDIILYTGELGAGKTHFTKGIARRFGINERDVTSPTFTIVNEYTGRTGLKMHHFDLYRIKDYDDLYATGFFDYLDGSSVICAEWSENIPGLSSDLEGAWLVSIEKTGDTSRRINIERLK